MANKRQVRKVQIETAEVVHEALANVATRELDLVSAENSLRNLGHAEPDASLVEQYAYQVAVLAELENLTGANCSGQIGKWNFRNEQTIDQSFNQYLTRRWQAIKATYKR
jgi:hypothetical protein